MKKIKIIFCIIILTVLSSCMISRDGLSKANIYYTNTTNKNYVSLGKCIRSKFGEPTISHGSTYVAQAGVFVPTSTTTGVEALEDSENKIYYVNDFFKGGLLVRVKNWIVIVKSLNESDTKSEVTLRGRQTLTGSPTFAVSFVEDRIKQCL